MSAAQHILDEVRALAPRQAVLPPAKPAPQVVAQPIETTVMAIVGENLADMVADLAAAQAEFTVVERTLTAKIKSRREGGADFTYDYAPLSEVLAAVTPALNKHGVFLTQPCVTKQGKVTARTTLLHKSGTYIYNDCTVPCEGESAQAVGSAQTYAKRYGLQSLLGIHPDYDDDGGKASGRDQQIAPKGQSVKNAPAPTKVLAVRKVGDQFGVKTSVGEFWTDDPHMAEACKAACAREQAVDLVTEERADGKDRKYRWIVELRSQG